MFVDRKTDKVVVPLNYGLGGATGKLELVNST